MTRICKGPSVGKSLACLTIERRTQHSEQGESGNGMNLEREADSPSFARPWGLWPISLFCHVLEENFIIQDILPFEFYAIETVDKISMWSVGTELGTHSGTTVSEPLL